MASFRGDLWFLSNFYPCKVTYKGRTYQCAEAAYVAERCVYTLDKDNLQTMDGSTAKRYGKNVQELAMEWQPTYLSTPTGKEGMLRAMFEIVLMKFAQNPDLRKKLAALDGDIVEVNEWHDTFWGVCDGVGSNYLGKILMRVRDLLK